MCINATPMRMATTRITLSLPEDLVHRAEALAAQRGTSVSALVSDLLEQHAGDVRDYDEVWAEEERLMRAGILTVRNVDWSRDDLHAG
jgi:hypothetical protein